MGMKHAHMLGCSVLRADMTVVGIKYVCMTVVVHHGDVAPSQPGPLVEQY